eukprot:scaffold11890_cov112-Isochrysis_galbana.AAC.2
MAPGRAADAVRMCSELVSALHVCKQKLGLMPQQCYPSAGYSGECDTAEHNLKHCMAHAADPDAARVLYDNTRSREVRIVANQRIQRKLKRNHVPCVP